MTPPIAWLGPLRDPSGYSNEARGFLAALEAGGLAPVARDLPFLRHEVALAADEAALLERQLARTPPADRPHVLVHHYTPFARQDHALAAANVARCMFETDALPAAWRGLLRTRHRVWVPSAHNVETFARGGIDPDRLRVLGGTLDFDAFGPGTDPYPLPDVPDGHRVFLTNFDFSERKAWRTLLRAWARAFAPTDPVCLLVKTTALGSGGARPEERIEAFVEDELGGARAIAPVRVLSDVLSGADLPRLYAAADAYVLASRGEGWGRPWMEALAMGLPTIASRHSGTLEFMSDEYSWLVGGAEVPIPDASAPGSLYRGHSWFEPDLDELSAALADVARNFEAARSKAAPARASLLARFGPLPLAGRIAALAAEALEAEDALRPPACIVRGARGRNAAGAGARAFAAGVTAALTDAGEVVGFLPPEEAPLPLACAGLTSASPPELNPPTVGPAIVAARWDWGRSASPAQIAELARAADRVWVETEYARGRFAAAGLPPGAIDVVPTPLDVTVADPDAAVTGLGVSADCVFLAAGSAEARELLLAAWERAFDAGDDVALVLPEPPQRPPVPGSARVVVRIAPGPLELAALTRAADVLVVAEAEDDPSPPVRAALACGTPVLHGGGALDEVVLGGGWRLDELDDLTGALRGVAADRRARDERAASAAQQGAALAPATVAAAATRSLATLAAERLPLARNIVPAGIDSRAHLALYAPEDWTRSERWRPVVAAWAAAFGEEDPVTLALVAGEGTDIEALSGELMTFLAELGPDAQPGDLALCTPSDGGLAGLLERASAVVLDEVQAAGELPALVRRRARALLPAADGAALAAWRARCSAPVTADAGG